MLFLSLATLWTGWAFLQYRRSVASGGASLLAASFILWGLHHLDYPFLRARGAWNPWGYYIDILLTLAVGTGILLLVLDDLRRGLGALSDLARFEQPKKIALLPHDLTVENGFLTPSLKVKRRVVEERLADVIHRLYEDEAADVLHE